MIRPTSPFDAKDIRDYNQPSTIMSLRANCARAVELDDKQGGKKEAPYLSAMKATADAIYSDLGIKVAKGKAAKPVDVKESAEYKELDAECEELDKDLTAKTEEVETLNLAIKELKEQLEEAKKPAVKKTAAKKTTAKKGAK